MRASRSARRRLMRRHPAEVSARLGGVSLEGVSLGGVSLGGVSSSPPCPQWTTCSLPAHRQRQCTRSPCSASRRRPTHTRGDRLRHPTVGSSGRSPSGLSLLRATRRRRCPPRRYGRASRPRRFGRHHSLRCALCAPAAWVRSKRLRVPLRICRICRRICADRRADRRGSRRGCRPRRRPVQCSRRRCRPPSLRPSRPHPGRPRTPADLCLSARRPTHGARPVGQRVSAPPGGGLFPPRAPVGGRGLFSCCPPSPIALRPIHAVRPRGSPHC